MSSYWSILSQLLPREIPYVGPSLDERIDEEDERPRHELCADERAPSPDELVEQRDLAVKLASALESLPCDSRAVFIAHALEGRSYRDIAREHGTYPVRIERVYTRARRTLQHLLASEGVGEAPDGFRGFASPLECYREQIHTYLDEPFLALPERDPQLFEALREQGELGRAKLSWSAKRRNNHRDA